MVAVVVHLAATAEEYPDQPFLRWWPAGGAGGGPGPAGDPGPAADPRPGSGPGPAASPRPAGAVVRELTYRDEYLIACGVAAVLRGAGVRAGSRVAAALPNGPDLVHLWFATAALGAVLMPLDPRLTDLELAALLRQAGPDLAVLPPARSGLAGAVRLLPAAAGGGLAADCDTGTGTGTAGRGSAAPAVPPADPRAPVAVLFTSGSTGRPKGCLVSHDGLVVPAEHMARRLGLGTADVLLHVLPLHHMAGLSFLTTAVAAGATVALRPRFSGRRFWSDVATGQATVFRHLGEMLAVLDELPGPPAGAHPLRLVYGGGASAAAARFADRFGVPAVEGYGLSETNTVLCGRPGPPALGTLGRPLPHVTVRLVDRAGQVVAGAGTGELQVRRNPALMLAYLAAPAVTADAFDGPWFRTGDLVCRDDEGTLRFAGRITEVIRRRGENIDPAEIEQAVEACPGVGRAAAIGVPAEFGGVEIQLFAQPADGSTVTAADIRAWCADRLAAFKLPRDIRVVRRLPLTRTHKVDKAALREWAMTPLTAAVHSGVSGAGR